MGLALWASILAPTSCGSKDCSNGKAAHALVHLAPRSCAANQKRERRP
jgi:hypothetical protein